MVVKQQESNSPHSLVLSGGLKPKMVKLKNVNDFLPKPEGLEKLFPHQQRFILVNGRRTAYIDEGDHEGRPLLLLYGNPTYGFLYRDFIAPLTGGAAMTVDGIFAEHNGQLRDSVNVTN